ncbi:MAG TPA: ABC-2 family transporter protein [Streptosporangiaceae bacterium]
MSAVTAPGGRRALGGARGLRVLGITALSEFLSPNRMTAVAVRLAVQLFLVVCLWRALYTDTTISVGLTKEQAVGYAVLAMLALRLREANRWGARDTVLQHIELGTIVYWFLRPQSARRYYFLRAVGDQLYGFAWALAGYVICLAVGVLPLPASAGAALAFAVSFLLGQATLYYLTLLTDQLCFWTIRNNAAVDILKFAMNLLSGAYAPLWFFPGWFRVMSAALPFQSTMNVPLSFYIGRLRPADLPAQLALQAAWVLALALLTRLLWRRVTDRVVSQGG